MRQMSRCLHHELGLTPTVTEVTLCGSVLSVCLMHALTPMARMITQKEAGAQIVQDVYDALLAECREQLGCLALQITGRSVRQIRVRVNVSPEAVMVEFVLQGKESAYG